MTNMDKKIDNKGDIENDIENVPKIKKRESIESVIKRALDFPFYQWFWNNEERPYEELPMLTKKDLFKYTALTDRNYYEGYEKVVSAPYVFFLTTSGSTGRLLEVPRSYHNIVWLFRSLSRNLRIQVGTKPVMIAPICRPEDVFSHVINFPLKNEILRELYQKELEPYMEIVPAPYEEIPRKVIDDTRINVIWDLQGVWFYENFIETSRDMSNIKALQAGALNPSVIEPILKSGIKINSIYAGVDLNIPNGQSCPVEFSYLTFHVPEEYIEFTHVYKNGEIKEEGKGELITSVDSPFPLIKYASGDLVELSKVKCGKCGYKGVDLKLLGKAVSEVRIRSVDGPDIDINKLIRDLSGFGQVLVMYGKLRSERYPDKGEFRGIVSFVEADIDRPILTDQFDQIIMQGFGMYNKFAMAVILVPRGTISNIRVRDRKPREYIDVMQQFPSLYEPCRETAGELGYHIL